MFFLGLPSVHCENARAALGQMLPSKRGKRHLPAECLHSGRYCATSNVREIYREPIQLMHMNIFEIVCYHLKYTLYLFFHNSWWA